MAETSDVAIVKTGDTLVPAATVTDGGTVTPKLLLERFTTVSTRAVPFMVILFAEVDTLPITDVGDKVTERTLNGLTAKLAVFVIPA